jgi:L-ascorbate metabolism protein UlaG (beta-lactamase superfamily)
MTLITFVVLIGAITFAILKHPKSGRIPRGERLERIKKSPNFRDGIFQNLNVTPQLAEDAKFTEMMKNMFVSKDRRPKGKIPSIKTDLNQLPPNENILVWFGHSSYFMQIDGKTFLVDPVFSGNASPFSFSIKAFEGADVYTVEDLPEIDYMVITHDHWDHLDYKTIVKLKSKVKKIITGLGPGEHLEYWGYKKEQLIEKDWFESEILEKGFKVSVTPARHFSGRGFKHKRTLWSSFVLETPTQKIFIGGDGGYDEHFTEIGEKFGGFDLAILECGQYNKNWKYIHMLPDQTLQAGIDLKAKRLFPVHNSKFALAYHTWDEPLKTITALNKEIKKPMITPRIGELVHLKDPDQKFSEWWTEIE